MIRELTPRIRKLAARVGAKGAVDADDLVQAALIQVLRARRRFDPARGTSWRTFALTRARFAMLDELREVDHVPRLERIRAKREGRKLPRMLSMQTSDTRLVPRDLPDLVPCGPVSAAVAGDLWATLPTLVGRRRARVLEAYYRHGFNLKKLGRILGMSESRACQLRQQGIERLRAHLEKKESTS